MWIYVEYANTIITQRLCSSYKAHKWTAITQYRGEYFFYTSKQSNKRWFYSHPVTLILSRPYPVVDFQIYYTKLSACEVANTTPTKLSDKKKLRKLRQIIFRKQNIDRIHNLITSYYYTRFVTAQKVVVPTQIYFRLTSKFQSCDDSLPSWYECFTCTTYISGICQSVV